ncbi:hypothetical protein ACWEWI_02825 [Streptomyces sp. NPDC003753]
MTKMTRITGVLGTAAAGLMLLSTPALAGGGALQTKPNQSQAGELRAGDDQSQDAELQADDDQSQDAELQADDDQSQDAELQADDDQSEDGQLDPNADLVQLNIVYVYGSNNDLQFCLNKAESENPTVNAGGVSNPDGANCLNHQHDASNNAFDVD